jgi:hypothetical protein
MKSRVLRVAAAVILCMGGVISMGYADGKDIKLVQPKQSLGTDVMTAFRNRKSVRSFVKGKMLSMEDLATILWSGYGVNRSDGMHTVATAYGKDVLDLYVAMGSGIYKYVPSAHVLAFVSDENIKAKIAKQDFVADAAVVVVMVGKTDVFAESSEQAGTAYINYTAGAASENMFLAADSLSLATVVMANIDQEFVRKSMKLKESQVALYIMPIGYPK